MHDIDDALKAQLDKLQTKYQATGQDMVSYLEGLYHTDFLNYWDYVHTDALLALQIPRTNFPDEQIFIIYHQITELYFKLILSEMKQISDNEQLTVAFMLNRVERINRYWENLVQSFAVMVNGMDTEQFMNFRMALLPASGFQSAQYRLIEIGATDFINLVSKDHRAAMPAHASIEQMYEHIYWKAGATELATGKKTLTLVRFEAKYSGQFVSEGKNYLAKNLRKRYQSLPADDEKMPALHLALRAFDTFVNVNWPLAHLRSAGRYLHKNPEVIAATGGTNWQKYLPPRFQKRIFFPELWTAQEIEEWGKNAVLEAMQG
jgi:tryptophan 2,3-dioxygenase